MTVKAWIDYAPTTIRKECQIIAYSKGIIGAGKFPIKNFSRWDMDGLSIFD
jgi:hypothetical protein